MTISTTGIRTSYSGNGVTVAFSFPYRFLADADLDVTIIASDGTETVQVLNTDYTVAGAGEDDGGTVTMVTAPASGETLLLVRSTGITQEVDYITGDPFPAETHEEALDRLTIIAQEQQNALDRSLTGPLSDDPTLDMSLPGDSDRAGTVLAFDEDGAPIVGPDITSVETVADNITDINDVADNMSDINDVQDHLSSIDTVAGNISDINDVQDNLSDINDVADDLNGTDTIGTVAGSIANVNTVGSNITDVTTVADNIADVNTVADDISAVVNVSDAIDNGDLLTDVYQGASATDPTTRLDGSALQAGDIYFNTLNNIMRTYTGTEWINAASGLLSTETKTLASGQTEVTFASSILYASFYINGPDADNGRLVLTEDYSVDVDTKTVTLVQSYPAGTYLSAVKNEIGEFETQTHNYTNITALRGAYITDGAIAIVRDYSTEGDGGGGTFRWDNSDLSTEVTADTQSGIYVAPTSDLTGASGAWVRQYNGSVNVKWFGAVGDGVTDDTDALNAAFMFHAYIPSGEYLISDEVQIQKDVTVNGDGLSNTVITAKGNTTGTFTNDAVVYKYGDEPTQISDLDTDVSKGEKTLSFASAHGLSVGDPILIYNPTDYSYSPWRSYYRAGEYCTVAEVTSTTEVLLEAPLYADYLAADIEVYECTGYGSGELKGFKVIAPGPGANGIVRGLDCKYLYKLNLDDVGGDNSDNASVGIGRCYKVFGKNLDCHQWSEDPGFGTQYGLVIANSQELDLTGRFVGYRHGISHGGGDDFGIPCRASRVHDFFAKNNSGALAAADWHGNCEWCSYESADVAEGGFNFAGNHNRISGFIARGDNLLLVLGRELVGCDHIIENGEVYSNRDDNTRGIIDVGGNSSPMTSDTTEGGTFVHRNIKAVVPNAYSFVSIRNRGYTGDDWNAVADNIQFNGHSTNAGSVLSLNTISGDEPTKAGATNILIDEANTGAKPLYVHSTTTLVRQDSESGATDVTTNTGATSAETSVTFKYQFAKVPHVICTSNSRTTGSDRIAAYSDGVTASDFDAQLSRIDIAGTNFGAAITRSVYWIAVLKEW